MSPLLLLSLILICPALIWGEKASGPCSVKGWHHFEELNTCLHPGVEEMEFEAAKEYCEARNGHMVHPRGEQHLALMRAHFPKGAYWVGVQQNGTWYYWFDKSFAQTKSQEVYSSWKSMACPSDVCCLTLTQSDDQLYKKVTCDSEARPMCQSADPQQAANGGNAEGPIDSKHPISLLALVPFILYKLIFSSFHE
jgi:hypothetical protein